LALACGVVAGPALADTPPPAGADALASARNAWAQHHFKDAEPLYKSALDHGGLAPSDTLDAYAHLGAARAALGRTDLSRAAFRQAAFIDAHFEVPALPRVASRRAHKIASLARRDEAKLGSIRLNAAIPQSVPAGESFTIDATLDARHAGVTAKIGIDARDSLSGKHYSTTDVAAPTVHFEVPADVTLPGATLVVRVDALDPHDNRLASREQRVQVQAGDAPAAEGLPKSAGPNSMSPMSAEAPAALTFDLGSDDRHTKEGEKHGGFWHSPWPYFIGGLVLAAGGAVTYYELRPTDDVSLGAARVTTR
jgi:hypothetical protein